MVRTNKEQLFIMKALFYSPNRIRDIFYQDTFSFGWRKFSYNTESHNISEGWSNIEGFNNIGEAEKDSELVVFP